MASHRHITRILALGLALAVVAISSGPATAESPPLPAASPTPPIEVTPLYEALTRKDHLGRILVPVSINGQGPFRFILDTGANRSVLTPRLAESLHLVLAQNEKVVISGVTGVASVPTATVEQMKVGDIVLTNQQLPVADSLSPDTDGVLGVDALVGTRVLVSAGKTNIRKAHREGVMDGLTRIPAQFRFGRLLVIRASVGRIPVKAVIDTGSQHTLANNALRRRLGLGKGKRPVQETVVIGETLTQQPGEIGSVPLVRMGKVQIIEPIVVFGDFHVFKLWRLESEPALILGMDLIGTLHTLLIDYQRGEIQIRPRQFSDRWID